MFYQTSSSYFAQSQKSRVQQHKSIFESKSREHSISSQTHKFTTNQLHPLPKKETSQIKFFKPQINSQKSENDSYSIASNKSNKFAQLFQKCKQKSGDQNVVNIIDINRTNEQKFCDLNDTTILMTHQSNLQNELSNIQNDLMHSYVSQIKKGDFEESISPSKKFKINKKLQIQTNLIHDIEYKLQKQSQNMQNKIQKNDKKLNNNQKQNNTHRIVKDDFYERDQKSFQNALKSQQINKSLKSQRNSTKDTQNISNDLKSKNLVSQKNLKQENYLVILDTGKEKIKMTNQQIGLLNNPQKEYHIFGNTLYEKRKDSECESKKNKLVLRKIIKETSQNSKSSSRYTKERHRSRINESSCLSLLSDLNESKNENQNEFGQKTVDGYDEKLHKKILETGPISKQKLFINTRWSNIPVGEVQTATTFKSYYSARSRLRSSSKPDRLNCLTGANPIKQEQRINQTINSDKQKFVKNENVQIFKLNLADIQNKKNSQERKNTPVETIKLKAHQEKKQIKIQSIKKKQISAEESSIILERKSILRQENIFTQNEEENYELINYEIENKQNENDFRLPQKSDIYWQNMTKDQSRNEFLKIIDTNQNSRDSYTLLNMTNNSPSKENQIDKTQLLTFRSNLNQPSNLKIIQELSASEQKYKNKEDFELKILEGKSIELKENKIGQSCPSNQQLKIVVECCSQSETPLNAKINQLDFQEFNDQIDQNLNYEQNANKLLKSINNSTENVVLKGFNSSQQQNKEGQIQKKIIRDYSQDAKKQGNIKLLSLGEVLKGYSMKSGNKENKNDHQVANNYLTVQMMKPGHISVEKQSISRNNIFQTTVKPFCLENISAAKSPHVHNQSFHQGCNMLHLNLSTNPILSCKDNKSQKFQFFASPKKVTHSDCVNILKEKDNQIQNLQQQMKELNEKILINEENEKQMQQKLIEQNRFVKNLKSENQALNLEIQNLRNMLNWFSTNDLE